MTHSRIRRRSALALIGMTALAALTLSACSSSAAPEAKPSSSASETVSIGDPSKLKLVKEGTLTVHVDDPVWSPWFIDNTPDNGKGFESALTYAVAEKLGFKKDQVKWGYTAFAASFTPGPKDFDFYTQEVSITDERAKAVSFSDPYYTSRSVVITKDNSPALEAKSVADLAKYRFGTVAGTTQDSYITQTIKPKDVLSFDTVALSTQALENGQVDAIVVDLQIGQNVVLNQFKDLKIAGLLKDNGVSKGMGFVFDLNSPLVPAVDEALSQLRSEGKIDALEKEWLPLPAEVQEYTQ
ncbi:amino acid ABC transporter substrate-binding protein [Mycetocola tolaasinivorans]|uniref:Amino acid ABC transporter substrate-binding protein n=1 Tax=Mycetocola tolaasinivorans TaxID=76635 RepID=A0A3L7AAN4_9MICO|nr:ABC transporter substrate-binding protein [Mycetocola tolaasinivorans]RLP76870.1 amino acid ABC transporter substrate-binding protein [Mycetocola tolaasinivorans]